MFLLDVSSSLIEGNVVENNSRSTNRVGLGGDPNQVFRSATAPAFSDLPSGQKQVISFVLARRQNGYKFVNGNVIRDNSLRAYCVPSSVCVGLGYFASRSTGYGPGGSWSAGTTNYYTLNDPFGSQIGSVRCGGNWYAANSTCTSASSPPDCNADDYQHNPPAGTTFRNDGCNFY